MSNIIKIDFVGERCKRERMQAFEAKMKELEKERRDRKTTYLLTNSPSLLPQISSKNDDLIVWFFD